MQFQKGQSGNPAGRAVGSRNKKTLLLEAALFERLPGKLLTRDQLLLLERDNVVAGGAPGLMELGITPTPVELVVPSLLQRFQPGGGKRDIFVPG